MPLLPYCVFLSSSGHFPGTGVEDRSVLRLDLDGLSVIYSDLGTNEIVGNNLKTAALRFHEIVQAVFEQRAVIPFRFPTLLTEEELRDHVEKESQQYLKFLRTHADDVQMEIRLWRVDADRPKPAGGTEYMAQLLEHHMLLQHASRKAQRVSEHLVLEWKRNENRDSIRLFALIWRKHANDFREALAEMMAQRAHIRMRVTGPWPATEFFPKSARSAPENFLSLREEE